MKKYVTLTTLIIVAALIVTLLSGCQPASSSYAESYITVKINPEIELIVNDEGIVEAVYCVNEDAEILLSNIDLTDTNIEEALEEIVSLAVLADYIDIEDENEIEIGVISNNLRIRNRMQNRLRERINRYFSDNHIFGRVIEPSYQQYRQQAVELGITPGHALMMNRALEANPLLELDDVKEMPINQLAHMLRTRFRNNYVNAGLRQEYMNEITNRFKTREQLKQQIRDLEEALDNGGDEDEQEIIEEELIELQAELELLMQSLEEEEQAIMEQFRLRNEETVQAQQQEMEKLMNENSEKLEAHEQNNNSTQNQAIVKWQKGNSK